jgi:phosphatidylglycerol---prolipoprotein diacylglyceryl transferase
MLPEIEVGSLHLATYNIAIAIALIVAGMIGFQRLLRLGVAPAIIRTGILLTIVGGFAGMIGMMLLINALRAAPDGITPVLGRGGTIVEPEGRSVIWGLVSGSLITALYCRRHHASLSRVFDLGIVPVPLGQAIGRLGCLAAGCCYGKVTASPLGMYLPDEYGVWAVRYPTQLMSSAVDLFIFITLIVIERHRRMPFDGFLALLFVILFCAKRFAIGFLRETGEPLIGPLTWFHLNALIGLSVAGLLIVWNLRRAASIGTPATT